MDVTELFIGPLVHSVDPTRISIIPEGVVAVLNGKIIAVDVDLTNLNKYEEGDGNAANTTVRRLKPGQFLCPGFIDLHIHASQYPNIGLGYDKSLLDWLHTYIFSLERKYANVDFAENVYRRAVKSTLKCGTTTACYYGTIHTDSCLKLAEIISNLGQRALVGKVNMDQNAVPDYVETTCNSLKDTEKFVEAIKKMKNPLVQPAITPRFAIACSKELMKKLGDFASKHDLYIQTHICESKDEIAFTKHLNPESPHYAGVYHEAGLLTSKTILGHGVFLTSEEKELLSLKNCSVAHCPNSNIMLRSGNCDVRQLQKSAIKIGLGTDVSGGSHPSVLDAMRFALSNSLCISFNDPSHEPLTYHEVFYMATLGGAKALSKDKEIGNFVVGKDFDALIVDMNKNKSNCAVFANHDLSELVQKFIYCGDDRNICEVYVNGKCVIKK